METVGSLVAVSAGHLGPTYLLPQKQDKMKSLAAIVALATFLAVPATAVPVWGQCKHYSLFDAVQSD